jgi:hypothetical protein
MTLEEQYIEIVKELNRMTIGTEEFMCKLADKERLQERIADKNLGRDNVDKQTPAEIQF